MHFLKYHLATPALILMLALSLYGCGGGGADLRSEVSTTTTGQELMDLQKAHESGALTDEEYESEKKKVLKGK